MTQTPPNTVRAFFATLAGKLDPDAADGLDVVYQFNDLSMGWCINCHRETEVKFTSNEYYNTYKQYHDAIAKGQKTKVTVEDIGGLECQKCHY